MDGLPAATLHPPVPVPGAGLPWDEREDVVLCVARMSPEKRLVEAVGIVRRLRERGHDLRLAICGLSADPAYRRCLERTVAAAGDWAELDLDLPREALVARMARARYGLHTMIDEHFGIAVAELVRMGCLTFVHGTGGAREIVAEPRLCFASDDEAVEQIARCLTDPDLAETLHLHLARRATLYGTERFVEGLQACCEQMVAACANG